MAALLREAVACGLLRVADQATRAACRLSPRVASMLAPSPPPGDDITRAASGSTVDPAVPGAPAHWLATFGDQPHTAWMGTSGASTPPPPPDAPAGWPPASPALLTGTVGASPGPAAPDRGSAGAYPEPSTMDPAPLPAGSLAQGEHAVPSAAPDAVRRHNLGQRLLRRRRATGADPAPRPGAGLRPATTPPAPATTPGQAPDLITAPRGAAVPDATTTPHRAAAPDLTATTARAATPDSAVAQEQAAVGHDSLRAPANPPLVTLRPVPPVAATERTTQSAIAAGDATGRTTPVTRLLPSATPGPTAAPHTSGVRPTGPATPPAVTVRRSAAASRPGVPGHHVAAPAGVPSVDRAGVTPPGTPVQPPELGAQAPRFAAPAGSPYPGMADRSATPVGVRSRATAPVAVVPARPSSRAAHLPGWPDAGAQRSDGAGQREPLPWPELLEDAATPTSPAPENSARLARLIAEQETPSWNG